MNSIKERMKTKMMIRSEKNGTPGYSRKRAAAFLLAFLLLSAAFLQPAAALAENGEKVVRVGWYDSSFNRMDEHGCRSGYAYEYQIRIAAYTGWKYEYVKGSWSELLALLQEGSIDLMSDISYTPERAETMLYPSLPMGSEEYYLFVSQANQEISSANPASLNGKKIGVNKDSVQAGFFREWAELHGVQCELLELMNSEDDSLRMLKSGVEPEQLNQVLTDCGTVSLKDVNAAYPDIAATLALYRSTGLASLLPEAERAARGGGFSAFEQGCTVSAKR